MIYSARCERIVSSGVVYGGNSAGNIRRDKAYRLNQILLSLIEDEIEFSFRTQHCLNSAGMKLIGQLVQKTEAEFLTLKNFGKRSLNEIKDVLADMRLTLEMSLDFPPWNGDGDGPMLIQVLSMQCVGGGFNMDKDLMRSIGVDLRTLYKKATELNLTKEKDNQLLFNTAYLLQLLETKFEQGRPYLADLIQRHKRWLQKELKRVSP